MMDDSGNLTFVLPHI